MTSLGADTGQLRTHGDRTETGGARIGEVIEGLRRTIVTVTWEGPDAEAFRDRAQGTLAEAASTVEALSARAAELGDHADEQDRASGDGDGGGSGHEGSGDPAEGGKTITDDGQSEGSEPLEDDIPLEGEDTQIENTGQGGIADCYLLSALGAIAQQDPEFLDRHVEEVRDGVYEVLMYDEDGNEVTYVVESTPGNGARFDSEEGGHSVYSIYERAYEMHLEQQGEGETLDWGSPAEAMQTMTGQDASFYGIDNTPPIGHLAELLENGRPMTAGTGGINEPNHRDIAGEHIYKISAVDEDAGTVTVVNPWFGNESVEMTYEEYVDTFAGTAIGRTEEASMGDRFEEVFDGTWRY